MSKLLRSSIMAYFQNPNAVGHQELSRHFVIIHQHLTIIGIETNE